MKPYTIGLDLDGIIANYAQALQTHLETKRNLPPGTLPQPTTWKFAEWDLTPQQYRQEHLQAEQNGMWTTIPIYPEAKTQIEKLQTQNIQTHIVTARHRPNPQRYKQTLHETKQWLQKHGIHTHSIIFTLHKPDTNCDIYLEDSPKETLQLLEAGKQAILLKRTYNQTTPQTNQLKKHQAQTWEEATHIIQRNYDHYNNTQNQ